MSERKQATSPEYMAPAQRHRDPVTRQTLAIAFITVPAIFGAFTLSRLGTDAGTLQWVVPLVVGLGAFGGWIHHPVRRFRQKGAAAGVLVSAGALTLTYLYVTWRGGDRKILSGTELMIPIALGAAPGLYYYYSLLRDEQVGPWETPPEDRPRST